MNRIGKKCWCNGRFLFIFIRDFLGELDWIENRVGFRLEWLKDLEIGDFDFWGKGFLVESWRFS